MKRLLAFIIVLVAMAPGFAYPIPATGTVEVFFSPHGGCTEAVTREIGKAQSEILVQAYSFTSKTIAKSLLDAHKRGVRVVAILDKSQRSERYSGATFLFNAGVPVLVDDRHAIAHNKIIIIDRQTLITGSFNFTKAADEKNAENLLIIKGNAPLVEKYLVNFNEHRQHSEPYTRLNR